MIDWNEISEFIIDMLDPKYRGNKGKLSMIHLQQVF